MDNVSSLNSTTVAAGNGNTTTGTIPIGTTIEGTNGYYINGQWVPHPYYSYPYYYSTTTVSYDVQIRKVTNGFIVTSKGTEHVFETLQSLNAFLVQELK